MKTLKRLLVAVLLVAAVVLPVLTYANAQELSDWWALRGYNPPADISKLAAQDTMTSYARHVFYVNHPDLESSANQFRSDCNESEKTIVLGCYHSDQKGIFIYNVNDKRLAGVQQVTAAHEMLHAAYDRLSTSDRNYVDGLLQSYYKTVHNKRIIDTINSYRKSEPNDVVNEMHSVFGTEISKLPVPLENYYKKYFADRHKLADYAAGYEAEFTSRQDQIKADDVKLAQMKAKIDAEKQSLDSQLSQINTDRTKLDALRSGRQYTEYNAAVPGFNAEVDAYNNGVAQLRDDIAAYNDLVAARNAIAKELTSLTQSIDTRLTTQSTQ